MATPSRVEFRSQAEHPSFRDKANESGSHAKSRLGRNESNHPGASHFQRRISSTTANITSARKKKLDLPDEGNGNPNISNHVRAGRVVVVELRVVFAEGHELAPLGFSVELAKPESSAGIIPCSVVGPIVEAIRPL